MKSNKLFKGGPDWWHNALIGNESPFYNKWDSYASGYKLAAETLASKVIQEVNYRDTLVFPIVFLYRHYFELRLKEIIEHGSKLLDEEYQIPKHHDLMIIWTQAKKLVLKIWPDSPNQNFKHIDSVLIDFINVDKMSDAFRYPIGTSGMANLQGCTHINIKSFVELITPVIEDFEGMVYGISVYEDYKIEMQEDYYSNLSRSI
jgi:hypothetical protein